MKMNITGNGARNLNKAALNSGRLNSATKPLTAEEAKAKVLNVINNYPAKKTAVLISMSTEPFTRQHYDDMYDAIRDDAEIEEALESAGLIGHLDLGQIRGTGTGEITFRVTESKRGKGGWSTWSKSQTKSTNASRRQLNSNHNTTRRSAVNAAARRPLAPVATERPMLNSSARRPVSRLTNTKADLKSSRRPARPLANDDKNYKLNSARRRPLKKLNSNRSAILKELEGWFDKDEAVEYLDSFEEQTGATATKLATDEEVDKYDGVFWATKDGKESLWCLHNGNWVEEDLDSAKNLNSAESEATAEAESTETAAESPAEETTAEESTETAEEEIEVTDFLIVQDPESKELSLFIPDTSEEAVPEDVEVIATIEAATAEDLDSSCGGKKKLNSSEEDGAEAATEDEAKEDTAEESESTEEEEAIVELPDGETVEVEDIFVVQTDDGEYDLFIAEEDAELPEEVEVVGEAVAVEEDEILNSSRQLKKLNSSKKATK